ncbi:MAG TPA: hypothetical protein VKB34_22795 [Povalibacter sp.]|nr:hypothetical protein [Povalibacter sp.]
MDAIRLLGWTALAYAALRAIRYLLGMRMYLGCALREVRASVADPQSLTAVRVRLLAVFDEELAAQGFHHLGYGSFTPLLTHYESPDIVNILVNESIPAYAFVRRRLTPEYGSICELGLVTEFPDGHAIQTVNTRLASSFAPDTIKVDERPGAGVAELVRHHVTRVAEVRARSTAVTMAGLDEPLANWAGQLLGVRQRFRKLRWTQPTANPALDSFTLQGALALTRHSMRVLAPPPDSAVRTAPVVSEDDRWLRIEADLDAVRQRAEMPERAPAAQWQPLALIATTAVISFAAMAWLWNPTVAALILAVIALHEAGHAVAMRLSGYRDVQVFFVPLLGAMTIGQSAASTIRSRMVMLLAGPVPGLWLAVALLLLKQQFGMAALLMPAAMALLIINGINLLPITPFDGGRVFELLSRPESAWRLAWHVISIIGLAALAIGMREPVIIIIAVAWAMQLRAQIIQYRLRKAVARKVSDRTDFAGVVRAALEVMLEPAYASWRSPVRQVTARALAKLFAEPIATTADRGLTIAAYACGWIPILFALVLWNL